MGNGVISSNDLMSKLVGAKKIMNKVNTGDFERGFVDESRIISNEGEDSFNINENINEDGAVANTRPVGRPDIDKINNSKLPAAIKQAMIENPIPEISLTDTLDMSFIEGAKKAMIKEGLMTKPSGKPQSFTQQSGPKQSAQLPFDKTELVTLLTPIIENVVRKTITEILDAKVTQILTAQQTMTINEDLVLKVGQSIFKGKITGVNKSK